MAWVSRTTRENNKVGAAASSTTNIGPGSYNQTPILSAKPSYAPFGSTNVRQIGGVQSLVTPGPGSYAPASNAAQSSRSVGGSASSFKSQSSRNDPTNSKFATPGPGSYTQSTSFVSKKKPGPTNRSNNNKQPATPSSVTDPYVPVQSAPSIPIVSQSFGYEQGPQGQLVMQRPVKIGNAVGPGSYNTTGAIQSKRVADFSRSSGRSQGAGGHKDSTPGPGQYGNYDGELSSTTGHRSSGNYSSAFKSSVQRNATSKFQRSAPGPGAYSPKSSLNIQRSTPEHLQFFGSTVTRFDADNGRGNSGNYIPGPGSYSLTKKPFKSPIKSNSAAFASNQKRFQSSSSANGLEASPDVFYESPTMASEVQKKLVGRTGAFGTSAKRFIEKSESQNSAFESSTATTPPPDNRVPASPIKKSAIFASKSTRFSKSRGGGGVQPSPGSYTVEQQWIRKGGKKGILDSNSTRSSGAASKNAAPGPGSYNLNKSSLRTSTGAVKQSASSRFLKQKFAQTPGPGAYNPDTVTGDMNRPTYNVTIVDEMEKSLR